MDLINIQIVPGNDYTLVCKWYLIKFIIKLSLKWKWAAKMSYWIFSLIFCAFNILQSDNKREFFNAGVRNHSSTRLAKNEKKFIVCHSQS